MHDRGYGLPRTPLLKLSEKGFEQRSDPVFSCIRSAKRTEKYGFGLPHGYAVSASEAFRPVSLGTFVNKGKKKGRSLVRYFGPEHNVACLFSRGQCATDDLAARGFAGPSWYAGR